MNDRLVWIDCEMTGLDLKNDVLLEIAALVTDSELNILDGGVDIVIHAGDDQLDRMIAFVRDMHAASGLTDDVRASAVTVEDAEAQVLAYIKTHVGEARKAPLCGNSIATDRGFLALQMPELETWLHYRMIDVSSVKELARRWYPRAYFASPEKNGGHRALADIRESIEELRYYRSTVFVPQPGPDSETAAKAASAILAAREPAVAETGTA
ncbi:MAG: oligoribonuclease [Frankiales bacterium]|nr:oligoribonuclease [Frankiales bacterium]